MNLRYLCASCTVGFLLLTLAMPIVAYAEFEGIRVTTHSTAQSMPAVSGDHIVWQDSRNTATSGDIYLYDIGTSMERSICTASRVQQNPAIDGHRIVWQDDRWGSGYVYRHDIYLYDVSTSVESPVTTATGFQMYPAISDTRIVWHDTRGSTPPNIYMYDLATGVETCLWQDPGSQYSPDISGDRVVCLDDRTGYRNVRLFDLSTQTETAITHVDSAKENVAICGDLIVWDDMRNGHWDIYLYNIVTTEEIRITSDPGDQKAPRVSSEAIVWENYRHDAQGDIYLYDLASRRTVPLVTGASRQIQPDIDGRRVVWTDDRHGNTDIFYLDYTLPTGADVEVTLADLHDPVLAGDVIIYHIRVRNNGPDTADGVVLVDWLDDGVEYISAYSTRGLCHFTTLNEQPVVICPMGDLEEGWYGDVTVLVRTVQTGTLQNRAEVDATAQDYSPANNTAVIDTAVVGFLKKGMGKGWAPRVKTDPSGAAHICFIRDGQNGIEHFNWPTAPRVHRWDDVIYANNRSGSWRREIVFDGIGQSSPFNVGNPHYYYEEALRADLAVDQCGHAHLAYVVDDVELNVLGQRYTNSLRLEYRNNSTGAWTSPQDVAEVQILEQGEHVHIDTGIWSHDIEVDADGKAHIVYMQCDGAASQGYLVYCTNRSGAWQRQVLPAKAYDWVAMALDADGWAHLAYYTWDLIDGEPVDYQGIAYLTNAPDGVWKTPEAVETLWSGGQMEGMRCDIEVDSQNRPHISYVSGQGQPQQDYRHAVRSGQGWVHSLIRDGSFATEGATLAIGPQDIPAVCFGSVYVPQEQSGWIAADVGGKVRDIAIDPAGGVHIVYSTSYEGVSPSQIYYYSQRGDDNDRDGIPDGFEAGLDGNDPLYDGNKDGIPDAQQDHVASFPTHNDYAYLTVECPDDYTLFNVGYEENPSPPDVPEDWGFVFDFIRLMVMDLPIGGSATVTVWLPEGTEPQVYYKYGPTPAMPTPHWYPFMYDEHDGTGAIIEGNRITLHFVDGQRGDNDLRSNGVIVDPGAPAFYQPCIVDLDDLVQFLDEWMMQPPVPGLRADFDGDGSVGLSDFIEFSRHWLHACPTAWPF